MRRVRDNQGGFTLIELMVVVMIIGVLIALGLPSFLGFRSRAQNAAAQHSLTVAHKVSFALAMQQSGFAPSAVLVATLPVEEPVYAWVDHDVSSTGPGEVSVADDAAGDELALAARSISGRCYYLRISLTAGISRTFVDAAATCRGDDYKDGADTGW